MQGNESAGNVQRSLKFFRDLQLVNPPLDAPAKLVRQCLMEDNWREVAMRVSMQASGLKGLACATKLGISESYLSRLVRGLHSDSGDLPEWFIAAFCWATGSRLLEQCIHMEQAERDEPCIHTTVRRMAAELRVAA